MKIAFLLLHYPVFSETFVSKELLGLQQIGTNGIIICEKRNLSPPFHPHIKQIKFPIHEITPKIFGIEFYKILKSHLFWLFHNPSGYLQSIKITLSFLNLHHLRVFIKAPLLAQKIKNEKVDLIYVHEVDSPCLFGLICSRLCHVPCGIIIHTQYLFAQNKFLSNKIRYADFIIFQSHYSALRSKIISQLPDKYFQQYNVLSTPGIDTNFFKPPANYSFSKQIKIISIGRLEEAKGYPHLLEAIKILKPKHPNIKLTIIGDGNQRPLLSNYISQNHLKKNIYLKGFLGHTPKLIKLLHSHHLFVLPSIEDKQKVHDVHPNVVKEAMSAGLLVITTRLGGIDEIINHQKNGFIINSSDPKTIASSIESVNSLPHDKKDEIAHNARKTIINHHQQQKICSQLEKIFQRYVLKTNHCN